MYEVLCQCDQACGIPHRHIQRSFRVLLEDGRETTLREIEYNMNRNLVSSVLEEIPASISVPVNWKEVAKAVMT